MRGRQLSYLPKISAEHGGRTREGKRKTRRPFDPKRPLHLVLKSSKARGQNSMLHPKNRSRVDSWVDAIAQSITGARKGMPGNFWDQPPYTRVVSWGRELQNLELYFIKNLFEAAGLLTREAKVAGVRIILLKGWHGDCAVV